MATKSNGIGAALGDELLLKPDNSSTPAGQLLICEVLHHDLVICSSGREVALEEGTEVLRMEDFRMCGSYRWLTDGGKEPGHLMSGCLGEANFTMQRERAACCGNGCMESFLATRKG